MEQNSDVSELWIQHQRRNNKTTQHWACTFCEDRRIFTAEPDLWHHFLLIHREQLPAEEDGNDGLESFRKNYALESAKKRPTKDESEPCKPEPPPAPSKRPLSTYGSPPARSLSGLGALNIGTPCGSEDIPMQDRSDDGQASVDQPRKRAAIGDGISAGPGSPRRNSPASPPPRRSKARPTSAPYGSESYVQSQNMSDTTRPQSSKRQLWTPDQEPVSKPSLISSNVASLHTQKQKAQGLQPKPRQAKQISPSVNSTPLIYKNCHINNTMPPMTVGDKAVLKDENYDIELQPETRPISQEQLVAEVKGIYAGLVMVEAKCIEVDNKQATLAQVDPGSQPKLNNEQWQALIALHRTLLHGHHDFFLASQHPSASPALRRLASKYAMPARMWRHGIHSFLELLRHRLPASLDHMLAFIYLAYSMMALLYKTVPAFKDTWIECLGDLGRYRMAIKDDDIRDREVWTGVARHWYSKASDKAPTTGRLYHHLAILARPNALQQLFYYAKSLCVVIPFTSARESMLTLFDPVLNANIGQGQGQYRLPSLDTAIVKTPGLLFTKRDLIKFEPAVKDFLNLLDSQIERVTSIQQSYHIAIANCVAMLGFASTDNAVLKAMYLPVVIHQSCYSAVSSGIQLPNVDGESKPSPVQKASLGFHPPSKLDVSSSPPSSIFQPMPGPVFTAFPEIPFKQTTPEDPEDGFRKGDSQATLHTRNHASELSSDDSLRGMHASITQPSNASSTSSLYLQNCVSRFIRFLDRGRRITALLFFLGQLKIVAAMPTPNSSNCAKEITGPLLIFTVMAALLSTIFIRVVHADQGTWRNSNLLMFSMIAVSIGTFFLGMDEENVTKWQLGLVWAFGTSLNVAYLKDKLIAFPKSGGLTALFIAALGLASAIFLVDTMEFKGRYADPWISGTITSLPTTVFFSLFWVAAFLKTGLAQKLEDGAYNGHILGFVNNFLLSFFTRIAEARVFGVMGNEAGRLRHQGWIPNTPEQFRHGQ